MFGMFGNLKDIYSSDDLSDPGPVFMGQRSWPKRPFVPGECSCLGRNEISDIQGMSLPTSNRTFHTFSTEFPPEI